MTTKTPASRPPRAASGAKIAARNAAKSAAALTQEKSQSRSDALVSDRDPALTDLKMKDLLEGVSDRSDLKKSEVKSVLEEALRQIGNAIEEGRTISLPGLGKVKVKRSKVSGNRRIAEVRIRQDVANSDAKA